MVDYCRECGRDAIGMTFDGQTGMRITAKCPVCLEEKVEFLCYMCVQKLRYASDDGTSKITIKLDSKHIRCLEDSDN